MRPQAWTLCVLACLLCAAEAARKAAPPPTPPPPPPPPPPTAAEQVLAQVSSLAAKACKSSTELAQHSKRLTRLAVTHAAVLGGAVKEGVLPRAMRVLALLKVNAAAEPSATVARILALGRTPLLPEAALVCSFAVCYALLLRSRVSRPKAVARAALLCAALNFLTFSFFVNAAALALTLAVAAVDALIAHPNAVVGFALLLNVLLNAGDLCSCCARLLPAPRPKAVAKPPPAPPVVAASKAVAAAPAAPEVPAVAAPAPAAAPVAAPPAAVEAKAAAPAARSSAGAPAKKPLTPQSGVKAPVRSPGAN